MNKILKDIYTGVNGEKNTSEEIERWYLLELLVNSKARGKKFQGRIRSRLLHDIPIIYKDIGKPIIDIIVLNLPHILLAKPEDLEMIADLYDIAIGNLRSALTKIYSPEESKKLIKGLNEEIGKAFDYTNYRKKLLPELAEKLNVKCCPYCNMHYTMLTYQEMDNKHKDRLTMFQFDHFFDKEKYPLLSMSLYNLIPSCANCNHKKTTHRLPLDFHPYHSDIGKKFHFEIEEGELNLLLKNVHDDNLKVKLVADDINDDIVATYQKEFNIDAIYSRHKDLIEEINGRIYLEKYYGEYSNFAFLRKSGISDSILDRIRYGNYMSPDDVGKRPMSKFTQDIYSYLKHLSEEYK